MAILLALLVTIGAALAEGILRRIATRVLIAFLLFAASAPAEVALGKLTAQGSVSVAVFPLNPGLATGQDIYFIQVLVKSSDPDVNEFRVLMILTEDGKNRIVTETQPKAESRFTSVSFPVRSPNVRVQTLVVEEIKRRVEMFGDQQ